MKKRIHILNSLVLLAIFFSVHGAFAQIPKLFLQFVEKQNKVQSGYVKLRNIDIRENEEREGNDTSVMEQETFFISTPKDLKYLTCLHSPYRSDIYSKSAHTLAEFYNLKTYNHTLYSYNDKIHDAKHDIDLQCFYYWIVTVDSATLEFWKTCEFQRIPPKINKKNIRYKILYPDDDISSNNTAEIEFDRKTFYWVHFESSFLFANTEWIYDKTDILEDRLYEYIHPDILDTISFMFEDLKKGYDRQYAVEQAKKDSAFRDSIVQSITKNGYTWADNLPQEGQQNSLFFMPEWKFPLLSGDSIYSDSINARFLLIDMWYISCYPCMKAMSELSSIDTLYSESLLKMISINVFDKDTAKMSKVVRNLNLKCDVACAYAGDEIYDMSKKMGKCQGYPQLYLIDMKTKQVIWSSCGWYAGFTKDIEAIIKANNK